MYNGLLCRLYKEIYLTKGKNKRLMIRPSEEDMKFIGDVKSLEFLNEKQFEEFWIKYGNPYQHFGFTKENCKNILKNPEFRKRRCEYCKIYLDDECDMIDIIFEKYIYLALFWIYIGNDCKRFEKDYFA